jgi:hypothetical protein
MECPACREYVVVGASICAFCSFPIAEVALAQQLQAAREQGKIRHEEDMQEKVSARTAEDSYRTRLFEQSQAKRQTLHERLSKFSRRQKSSALRLSNAHSAACTLLQNQLHAHTATTISSNLCRFDGEKKYELQPAFFVLLSLREMTKRRKELHDSLFSNHSLRP